jgi:hypothetical protein
MVRRCGPWFIFNFELSLLRTAMKQVIPETPPEYDRARIVERPDGFYWQSADSGKESGPFATLVEAVEDMQYSVDSDYEPGESVAQAEAEIGVADWVDPETGELAEDQTPRIEDH